MPGERPGTSKASLGSFHISGPPLLNKARQLMLAGLFVWRRRVLRRLGIRSYVYISLVLGLYYGDISTYNG